MNGHRPDNRKAVEAFAVVLFHCTWMDGQCVLRGGQYGHLSCHLTLHQEQSRVSSEAES